MLAVMSAAFRGREKLSLWFAYGAPIAMMVLGTLDAFMRYVMGRPILGVDGLIEEAFMPMIVYLAAAHIFAVGGHIRITVFSDMFPAVVRRWLFVLCFLSDDRDPWADRCRKLALPVCPVLTLDEVFASRSRDEDSWFAQIAAHDAPGQRLPQPGFPFRMTTTDGSAGLGLRRPPPRPGECGFEWAMPVPAGAGGHRG